MTKADAKNLLNRKHKTLVVGRSLPTNPKVSSLKSQVLSLKSYVTCQYFGSTPMLKNMNE